MKLRHAVKSTNSRYIPIELINYLMISKNDSHLYHSSVCNFVKETIRTRKSNEPVDFDLTKSWRIANPRGESIPLVEKSSNKPALRGGHRNGKNGL